MKASSCFLLAALLCGCVSHTDMGGTERVNLGWGPVFIAPFQSATTDENAARTMADLVGTALASRGVKIVTPEMVSTAPKAEGTAPEAAEMLRLAQAANATYVFTGTVHEYRYKTDLNGDPTVGLTLRLLDVRDGHTVWQGSSSQVGIAFASLTSTAQKAVHKLIAKLPVRK